MMFPTIHLNGTSARDLLQEQLTAMLRMRQAIVALQLSSPHGRDYYPQGPAATQAAIEEHEGRLLTLRNVLAELEAIAEHVSKHV